MNSNSVTFFTLLLLMISFKLAAQEIDTNTQRNKENATDSTMQPFWEDQSDWFRNNEVPSFVFVSPGKKFMLSIGGYVNLTASYDFDGISDNIDFIPYDIPVPQNASQLQQYQMYVNTSSMYFKIIQKTSNGNFIGYLSANFRGSGNTFGIFQVYAKYLGLEFGQDWSSFTDVASWPATVSFAGLNSMPEVLNVLLKYSRNIKNNFQFGISLEMPSFTTNYLGTSNINQRIPDIPGYLQYSFNNSHVRLSGIIRNLMYRDTINSKDRTVIGSGLSLTGNIVFDPSVQVYFQGLYGKGLGQYVSDLSVDGLNTIPNVNEPGKLEALPVYAYFCAVQYNFTQALALSMMYSQVKVNAKDYSNPAFYKESSQFIGNLFWNFIPAAQLGIEYSRGNRKNQNNWSANANRIEMMLQYNF